MVPSGKPFFFAASTATAASRIPSILELEGDLSCRSSRPLNKTRNPKPLEVRTRRLPCQVFEVSSGGALSQYPQKVKVSRKDLRVTSPGYMFRSKPRYVSEVDPPDLVTGILSEALDPSQPRPQARNAVANSADNGVRIRGESYAINLTWSVRKVSS